MQHHHGVGADLPAVPGLEATAKLRGTPGMNISVTTCPSLLFSVMCLRKLVMELPMIEAQHEPCLRSPLHLRKAYDTVSENILLKNLMLFMSKHLSYYLYEGSRQAQSIEYHLESIQLPTYRHTTGRPPLISLPSLGQISELCMPQG